LRIGSPLSRKKTFSWLIFPSSWYRARSASWLQHFDRARAEFDGPVLARLGPVLVAHHHARFRFAYGLGAVDVASHLNVSAEQVEAALAAALSSLRERLTPLPDERLGLNGDTR
jgi:hypothetical protein